LSLKQLFFCELDDNRKKEILEYLFNNFIRNGLYGRSKERTKLILLIDLTKFKNKGLLLVQTTITGKELKLKEIDGKTILVDDDRFLDEHNIYRFVYFYPKNHNDQKIYFIVYQKTNSEYFVKWLQIEDEMYDVTDELSVRFLCTHDNYLISFEVDEHDISRFIDATEKEEIYIDTSKDTLVIGKVKFKINKIIIKNAKKEFKKNR